MVMMTEAYAHRRQLQRLADDADQTELGALRTGQAILDQGLYDEAIADAMDDFRPDDTDGMPEWALHDLQQDDAVGGLIEVIEQRKTLLGTHYPFRRSANTLKYHPSKTLIYEFCLVTSITTEQDDPDLARTFEQLATLLSRRYLGPEGRAEHIGWPRKNRPRFRDAVNKLHEGSGEWVWRPEPGLPDDPLPRDVKDERLDFAAWIQHLDDRPGHLFLLGQCACGDNWPNKLRELSPDRLQRWFHPMCHVPATRAFCTPFHITDQHLVEASKDAGIVFDRIRLTLLAETAPGDIKEELARLDLAKYLPDIG
jgi:hypothetical protein